MVDDPWRVLPVAGQVVDFSAEREGYVSKIDAEKVGAASMLLGAGRKKKEDRIDHSVGIIVEKKLGDSVKKGETIARLFVSDRSDVESALKLLREAYVISDSPSEPPRVVEEVIK